MQQVGIVTITNGIDNYGNVLQNYALQSTIESMGYTCKTVKNFSYAEYRYTPAPFLRQSIIAPQKQSE